MTDPTPDPPQQLPFIMVIDEGADLFHAAVGEPVVAFSDAGARLFLNYQDQVAADWTATTLPEMQELIKSVLILARQRHDRLTDLHGPDGLAAKLSQLRRVVLAGRNDGLNVRLVTDDALKFSTQKMSGPPGSELDGVSAADRARISMPATDGQLVGMFPGPSLDPATLLAAGQVYATRWARYRKQQNPTTQDGGNET